MGTEDFGCVSGRIGSAVLTSVGCSRPLIRSRNILAILIIMNERQIDVMVLGFASNTEPSGLNIWKDNSNKLPKRSGVQSWYAFITTTLCVASENAITADGICGSLAVLLEPMDC